MQCLITMSVIAIIIVIFSFTVSFVVVNSSKFFQNKL